jgi:EAL domain-containing protein (putative c-di-GMP-specific phosphodiesterase class I)
VLAIERAIDQNQIAPSSLRVEVTEAAALSSSPRMREWVQRFVKHGVKLALDDFGTGYSNLALLHRMPFNELKIDQSFITDVATNRDSRVIVSALTGLARQFGLSTVAEGVEDLSTCALLRSVGVEQIQGFGIAPPLPAEHVVAWIAAYSPPNVESLAGG